MDYKILLLKLMEHFEACEGTLYLDDRYRSYSKADFTDEEWAELQRLANLSE
jgi:hypothetical protein